MFVSDLRLLMCLLLCEPFLRLMIFIVVPLRDIKFQKINVFSMDFISYIWRSSFSSSIISIYHWTYFEILSNNRIDELHILRYKWLPLNSYEWNTQLILSKYCDLFYNICVTAKFKTYKMHLMANQIKRSLFW